MADQIVNFTKNHTTCWNHKHEATNCFIWNPFTLDGTIRYLMEVMYYLCSKDTVLSKH